jgi:hypothetical protein
LLIIIKNTDKERGAARLKLNLLSMHEKMLKILKKLAAPYYCLYEFFGILEPKQYPQLLFCPMSMHHEDKTNVFKNADGTS